MITDEQVIKALDEFYHTENGEYHSLLISSMKGALELHEQSKPKLVPVAGCRIENDKVIAVDWDGVTDNCPTPLYTAPPTRAPLSDDFLINLAEECTAQFFNGVHQNATIHFARAVEKAHGIGTSHEPT